MPTSGETVEKLPPSVAVATPAPVQSLSAVAAFGGVKVASPSARPSPGVLNANGPASASRARSTVMAKRLSPAAERRSKMPGSAKSGPSSQVSNAVVTWVNVTVIGAALIAVPDSVPLQFPVPLKEKWGPGIGTSVIGGSGLIGPLN